MIINETLNTIKQRRSVRSFREDQIKEEELQAIVEAGMYAPSAGNQQAWHFTVVQNKAILERLNRTAKEAAMQMDIEHIRKMASNEKFNIFYGAPTAIIVSGREEAMVIESDCAAATQNLLLAAESLGLGSCWVNFVIIGLNLPAGSALKKELGIPEGYRAYASAVIGYQQVAPAHAPERKPDLVTYIR